MNSRVFIRILFESYPSHVLGYNLDGGVLSNYFSNKYLGTYFTNSIY